MRVTVDGVATSGNNPTGAAGGDLAGTYPNPTVDGITLSVNAQGDVYYRGATGLARLPAGTAGYALTTQGANQNPTWSAVSGLPAASAANEIPVSSGAGTNYVATGAAGVRAAISAAGDAAANTTTFDFASSTGWTLVDNAGSAAITGGVLRLSCTSTSTGDNGPRGYTDLGAVADPWAVEIAFRVAAHTGGSVSSQGRMVLQSTSPTTGASAKRFMVRTVGDGSVQVQIFPVAGPAVNSIIEQPAGTLVYDGNDWLIVRILGGVVQVWRARGSGGAHALPARTSWVLLGYGATTPPLPILSSNTMTNAVPPVIASGGAGGVLQAWDRLVFELVTLAAVTATFDVDDVSIRNLLP